MNAVTGKEGYLYDGNGRRARTLNLQTNTIEYFGYSLDGRLMQDWSNRRQVRNGYVYLGNTLVGLYEVNITNGAITPKYQHTDALGSPVVTTKKGVLPTDPPVVLSRMAYTPYGQPMAPMDGAGYTGHFIDVGTQLTYMQQRYYDAQVGRFLSVDPIGASFSQWTNFNRYWYAANNPMKFVDPDGRVNSLGVTLRVSEYSPETPSQEQMDYTTEIVDATVNQAVESGRTDLIELAKNWDPVITSEAKTPQGHDADTTPGNPADDEKTYTLFSAGVMQTSDSTKKFDMQGITAQGGSPAQLVLGGA